MVRIEESQWGIEPEERVEMAASFREGYDVDSRENVIKSPGSKRTKKKRKREDGAEEEKLEIRQIPLKVFGSDIMFMILSCLDARSVALSLLVSRGWHGVASSDRLWIIKFGEDKEQVYIR